jgi:uncharacterized membrane protein
MMEIGHSDISINADTQSGARAGQILFVWMPRALWLLFPLEFLFMYQYFQIVGWSYPILWVILKLILIYVASSYSLASASSSKSTNASADNHTVKAESHYSSDLSMAMIFLVWLVSDVAHFILEQVLKTDDFKGYVFGWYVAARQSLTGYINEDVSFFGVSFYDGLAAVIMTYGLLATVLVRIFSGYYFGENVKFPWLRLYCVFAICSTLHAWLLTFTVASS